MTCHAGGEAEGRAALAPLIEGLPEPLFDWRGAMPYPAVQSMFDGLLPSGLQWYWRGDFVRELPDAAIDAHLAEAAKAPTELSLMHLYPIDGAVRRVAQDATAWSCRDATWSMVIAGIDPDPKNAAAIRDWARGYWQAVHRFDLGGAYPNFMMDDEGARAAAGDLRRELSAAGGGQAPLRPAEPVPAEPEHPAGLSPTACQPAASRMGVSQCAGPPQGWACVSISPTMRRRTRCRPWRRDLRLSRMFLFPPVREAGRGLARRSSLATPPVYVLNFDCGHLATDAAYARNGMRRQPAPRGRKQR